MGLDGVEIIMAVEEAFDIRIEDSEAEKILTPRNLIDLIMAKVQLSGSAVCLTHRSFNLVRGFFVRTFDRNRSALAPRTALRSLLPTGNRLALVTRFATDLGVPAPVLERAGWLKALLLSLVGIAGFTAAFVALQLNAPLGLPILAAVAVTGAVAVFATRFRRTEFPKGLETIGDLSRWLMVHKPGLATPSPSAWTREQIAAQVQQIVIQQLSCEKYYHQDAHFVNDLGLDN